MEALVRRARELHPACNIPAGRSGNWRVEPWNVTAEYSARTYRVTEPGIYTALWDTTDDADVPVMSDTDFEIIEHVPFIEEAHGRVLITGLGLALMPLALLAFGRVTHIDIVERSEDVIRLVWPHVADPRLTLHHADAFDWDAAGRSWDFAWHDLTYAEHAPDVTLTAMKARYSAPVQRMWREGKI